MHAAISLLQALVGLVGVALALTSLWLFEDQEGKIQSWLENWWVRLDDRRKMELSRSAAFLQAIARSLTEQLDRLFGNAYLSRQAFRVSLCYSSASCLVAGAAYEAVYGPLAIAAIYAVLAFFFVSAGNFVLEEKSAAEKETGLFGTICLNFLSMSAFASLVFFDVSPSASGPHHSWEFGPPEGTTNELLHLSIVAVVVAFSFACGICFVVLTRRVLRRIERSQSVLNIALLLLANVALAGVLIAGPYFLQFVAPSGWTWARAAWRLGLLNTIAGLLSAAFIAVSLLMLAHRAMWPVVYRTLYGLQRMGIKPRRAFLLAIGLALLSWAGFHAPESVREIFKPATGGE